MTIRLTGTRAGLPRAQGTRAGLPMVLDRRTELLRVPGLEVARSGASRMEGQGAAMEPIVTEL